MALFPPTISVTVMNEITGIVSETNTIPTAYLDDMLKYVVTLNLNQRYIFVDMERTSYDDHCGVTITRVTEYPIDAYPGNFNEEYLRSFEKIPEAYVKDILLSVTRLIKLSEYLPLYGPDQLERVTKLLKELTHTENDLDKSVDAKEPGCL